MAAGPSAVPRLINYNGALKDARGRIATGVTGVTFLLYRDQDGGAPLWMETQNVTPDKTGHYTVQLGAASANGVPADIFMTGEARWLAVQVANQAEQPRVLLVAVPYAMKAADAETVGGLPASAFVLAAPASASTGSSSAGTTNSAPLPTSPCSAVTSDGTALVNQVSKFTAPCNIEPSAITENSGKVGIGTSTPATALDVKGAGTIRGSLTLPSTGTATATAGKNSQAQDWIASVFNSGTATAVPQKFQWQAEPAGNNTTTASGTLNLLYASGTATPAETGLKISNKGLFSFATGQTFPGTGNGTVTSVGSGLGLTGGPITTSGTLAINTAVVPQLAANNSFTGNQTIMGSLGINTAAPSQSLEVDSGNAMVKGPGNFKGTGNTAFLYVGDTNHPIEAIWNTGLAIGVYKVPSALFIQDQTGKVGVGTTTPASTLDVHGTGNFTGLITFAPGQSFPGTGTITGVTAGTDLTGGGSSGNVTLNLDTTTVPQLAASNTFTGNQTVNGNLSATGVVTGSGYQIGSNLFAFGSSSLQNAFLGFAGNTTMTGANNTATGFGALGANTTGVGNTASGIGALSINSTGANNTAIGNGAMRSNSSGGLNTAIGAAALFSNSTATRNVAIGANALDHATTGGLNTAVGNFAGNTRDSSFITSNGVTFLGADAAMSTGTLTNATAVGYAAEVDSSNAIVLGAINGVNGATVDTNVGIGTTAPAARLHVGQSATITGLRVEGPLQAGTGTAVASFGGWGDFNIDAGLFSGGRFIVKESGNVGINTQVPDATLTVNGSADKPGGGSWGTFSDGRLKDLDGDFDAGLKAILKLRPVRYHYKNDNALGIHDRDQHIGFVAQEVQKVIPEAVTENNKGYLLVNNDPILWTMLNAIKEQQREIVSLRKQVYALRVKFAGSVGGKDLQRVNKSRPDIATGRGD